MSQNPSKKLSERAKVKGAYERLDEIEKVLRDITVGVNKALEDINKALAQNDQNLAGTNEFVEVLVALVGKEQVQKAVEALRLQKSVEREQTMKTVIEKSVADGRLVVAEVIGDNSVIVGQETSASGTTIRAQAAFNALAPEFREKVAGQLVGFSFDFPDGGKFTVTEIYDIVVPAPAVATDASAPAQAPCDGSCENCGGDNGCSK